MGNDESPPGVPEEKQEEREGPDDKADLMPEEAAQTSMAEEPECVELTFLVGKSGTKTVKFNTKPLGMIFDHDKLPMEVRAVKNPSEANDAGVTVGMIMTHIGRTNIVGMQYRDAYGLLKDKVKLLPETTH